MEATQILNKQLKKAKNSLEKRAILHGTYKQLATSRKGRKANGLFREFVENNSYQGHKFAWAVAEKLDEYGLNKHAKRLRDQHSGIPQKPQKSWTEMPNLLGDKNTVEDLCSSGEAGKELAAFGCIAEALNRSTRARAQPADPKFLYPTSRQFPFDKTVSEIVKALEQRDFDAPGIKVNFKNYGPSDSYTYVGEIKGDDFKLWFCRKQGSLGEFNDVAAVTKLNIPKKQLDVFNDNSGPSFCLYVGKKWEADKESFVNSVKVNSKLYDKPKTYLRYSGSWQKPSKGGVSYPGKIAPFLAHTNDLRREYIPEGDEPTYFETQEVFQEFDDFLNGKLEQITSLEAVAN